MTAGTAVGAAVLALVLRGSAPWIVSAAVVGALVAREVTRD
jgi:type III secretory pathway component EscS